MYVHDKAKTKQQQHESQVGGATPAENVLAVVATGSGAGPGGGACPTADPGKVVL